ELELARIGPVDVFEDEDRRAVGAETLDHPTDGEEQWGLALGSIVGPEAEQERQVAPDLLDLRLGDQPVQRLHQLRPGDRRRVRDEDAGDVSDLFRAGAIAGLLLVRQRPAADRSRAAGLDLRYELLAEPRFPDPGRAEDRDQVRPA